MKILDIYHDMLLTPYSTLDTAKTERLNNKFHEKYILTSNEVLEIEDLFLAVISAYSEAAFEAAFRIGVKMATELKIQSVGDINYG